MGVYDIVKAAILTPTRTGFGIPIKLEGPVGVGKTSILTQIAEDLGFHIEVLTLSLMESVEAQGHPFLDEVPAADASGRVVKRRQMSYAPPGWALRAVQAERTLVFLDEVNMALPSTFAAFMRVVNERHCGAFPLGEGVRFVAACNPTDLAAAAGGVDMPPALNNRFCHLTVGLPDFQDWAGWLAMQEADSGPSTRMNLSALEARIRAGWDKAYQAASAEVIGYLAARPQMRAKDPGPTDVAFATPRTWEMFTRARAMSVVYGLSREDQTLFENGCIGAAMASEFRVWVADQDLPDADAWLSGTVDFAIDGRRLDRTQAFLIAVVIAWSNLPTGADKFTKMNRLVGMFGALLHRRDILAHATSLLGRYGGEDGKRGALALTPENRKVLAEIGSFRANI